MTTKPKQKQKSAPANANNQNAYHHGNLRQAIINATLELITEDGVNAVSIREVAKRLGVSAGAPFRHFPNKKALLTAVASEAMENFCDSIKKELQKLHNPTPAEGLRGIGYGYLRWALKNRAQFAVISNRDEIDFATTDHLMTLSEHVMHQMNPYIAGLFPGSTLDELVATRLVCRAFVYGLARMAIDRHFEEWNIPPKDQWQTVEMVLDKFMAMIKQ